MSSELYIANHRYSTSRRGHDLRGTILESCQFCSSEHRSRIGRVDAMTFFDAIDILSPLLVGEGGFAFVSVCRLERDLVCGDGLAVEGIRSRGVGLALLLGAIVQLQTLIHGTCSNHSTQFRQTPAGAPSKRNNKKRVGAIYPETSARQAQTRSFLPRHHVRGIRAVALVNELRKARFVVLSGTCAFSLLILHFTI